jgi:hypothetical protein
MSDGHRPGSDQQHIEVPELLRRDSGCRDGDVRLATLDLSALKRSQELRVEADVILQRVASDGGVLSPESVRPNPARVRASAMPPGKGT